MAIDHIEDLRREFPGHFQDRDPKILADEVLRVPTLDPDPRRRRTDPDALDEETRESMEVIPEQDPAAPLEDWLAEQFPEVGLDPLPGELIDQLGNHPGGLTNDPQLPGAGHSIVIERLAFYLPFHSYRDWWGIYIFPEGILRIRQELAPFFQRYKITPKDQVKVAKRILYHHEYYHHATESFGTRLEAMLGRPCYLQGFNPLYQRTFLTSGCLEETCANSYAREKTIEKSLGSRVSKTVFRDEINHWIRGSLPGYKEAANTGNNWPSELRPEFYESCLNACLPLLGVPPRTLNFYGRQATWLAAGHFDRGIGDVRSRISYVIQKGSTIYNRLPTDVRTCIKGGSFKQKLRRLRIGQFLRQGGSHEVWEPFGGGRSVQIPRHDGVDIPKGTMRGILRQLGSSMSIDDFLNA
jgi:predicted RNA binding protein YcfA (HicA-like mRNA interferase family)